MQGNKKWLEKAVGRKGSNQEARGGCLAVMKKGGVQLCVCACRRRKNEWDFQVFICN